jgi:hypothetical protein
MTILRLKAHQRQANIVEDIYNIFYYFTAANPGTNVEIEEFIQEWIDNVQPAILAFQSDQIVYLDIYAEVVGGLFFSSITQGSVDGVISCDANAPYLAYEFIYRRNTRATRNGFKRFAGVCEDAIDQGGNVTGAVATALTAAETVLDDVLNPPMGACNPIIYGPPTGPPNNLPERTNGVAEVAFHRVTTQNSRKPWR